MYIAAWTLLKYRQIEAPTSGHQSTKSWRQKKPRCAPAGSFVFSSKFTHDQIVKLVASGDLESLRKRKINVVRDSPVRQYTIYRKSSLVDFVSAASLHTVCREGVRKTQRGVIQPDLPWTPPNHLPSRQHRVAERQHCPSSIVKDQRHES